MAHDQQAWNTLQQARSARIVLRAATVQRMQDAAGAQQAWANLAATLPAGDARVAAAKSASAAAAAALAAARDAERQARAAVVSALAAWLDINPAADVRTMSAAYPIALFPVRLETRFDPPLAPTALKVRIYPDDIQSDTHEPELTAAEAQAGDTYWSSTAGGLDPAEAWRRLLLSFPAPRAAYLVRATDPAGTRPPSRPSAWTRPAEASLLPDRWIVAAYRGGREIYRAVTKPVVEPLALTISPLMSAAGDASALGADPDVGWAADFQKALDAGMAVSIALPAQDALAGFDRVCVLGVKASLSATDTAAQLADMWRHHIWSQGVAFVPQGSATNNTGDAPAAYPPDDPNGSVTYALLQSPPPGGAADGKLFMDALGLPADLAAPMAGAGRLEQSAAQAMSTVLWSSTWGYYLREWMALGFDSQPGAPPVNPFNDATIAAARDHFLGYVRARGPFPAFRIGATPYGLLPTTSLRHWTGVGSTLSAAFDLVFVQTVPAQAGSPSRDQVRIGRLLHSPANDLYPLTECGTPVPLTSAICAFAVAGQDGGSQPDLYILRQTGGPTGQIDYTVLAARAGYSFVAAQGASKLGVPIANFAFAVGNWDNDHKPDLFAINRQGATATEVSIFSGASNFQTRILLQAATSLPKTDTNWAFAVADWDKDGLPDLFAVQLAGAASQHVEVHILSGASQFRTEILRVDTGVAVMPGADVSVADWDGDGVLDIVLAQRNQPRPDNLTVTVLLGAQQFRRALPAMSASLPDADPPPGVLRLNPSPAFVIAADQDGDARPELLAIRNDGTSGTGGMAVTVLSASPITQFTTAMSLVDPNRGTRTTVASAALDLDGDGAADLVLLQATAPPAPATLSYRIARALDACGVPARFAPDDALPAGPAPAGAVIGAGVAAADLDGDGKRELVVFHLEDPNSRGAYRIGWKLDAAGKVDHWSADVAVPGPVGRQIAVRLGGSMTLADLDASGRPDMIVLLAERLNILARTLSLYYVVGRNLNTAGNVTGGWSNPVQVPFTIGAGSSLIPGGIAMSDIDGDGQLDVVVSWVETAASGNTVWYRIGWRLDATGNPQAGWSDPYRVPDTGAASIAGISLAHVSRGGWTGVLRSLVDRYRRGVAFVPRIGSSDDADADLVRALALHASSHRVAIRRVLGANTWLNLYTYLGTQAFFGPIRSDWATWYQRLQRRARTLFQGLGDPVWNAVNNRVSWDPRMQDGILEPQAAIFSQPLVAPAPLSESAPLPAINNIPNYLDWLAGLRPVHLTPSETALDNAASTDRKWPLLFYLARHGLLAEYAAAAFQIDVIVQKASSPNDDQDPELVGVIPGAPVRTVWNRLSDMMTVPGTTNKIPVWQYLFESRPIYSQTVAEYRKAMSRLRALPTAELDRLVSETLDACSHRVDCWATSMATRRLQAEMRTANPPGLYAGGFGWLENVVPRAVGQFTSQTVNGQTVFVPKFGGGYIHAPSAAMASAAAVLRNAYMSRGGSGSTAYAIDLSSERARVAAELLDGVRQGVSLAAALGYRLERILDGAGMQRYIDPLRNLYALTPLREPATGGPAGSTAGRTVVDGLKLRADWPNLTWGSGGLPSLNTADQQKLRQLLDAELGSAGAGSTSWLDPLDAVADLLTAEAVYQTVRGSKTGAAAALDALSQGTRPPEPEILRQPRQGVGVTHRVAFVLGEPAPALSGWPAATPRAAADPDLDSWIGSLLGDPKQVRCHAVVTTGRPARSIDVAKITLYELGLRPLDVLALARASTSPAGASELDRRVASAALALSSTAAGTAKTQVSITYTRTKDWAATERSFPDILELANSINAMLGHARPMEPVDLLPPEAMKLAAQAAPDLNGARARAQAAHDGLQQQVTALQTEAAAAIPDADRLSKALAAVSGFNLPGSVPNVAPIDELLQQAASVLSTAADRLREAQSAIDNMGNHSGWAAVDDARAAIQAIFGRDLPFLVAFTPIEAEPGSLAQAMGAQAGLLASSNLSAAEIVRRWFAGAARVRPALDRWRRASLFTVALGGGDTSWTVAQLPYRPGDIWAALPFTAQNGPPRGGLVSLMLDCVATPVAGAAWAGLVLDEWTEIIPSATASTSISFHYRSSAAQAPQAVLLAVPPSLNGQWDLEVLLAIVNETLDLAHVRAVDNSLAGSLGQFLPAALLAYNVAGDTVSTDLRFVENAE